MRLIDADLLRKQFRKRELEKNCRYMNGAMICNVRKIIDEAPTVERPHGEWIFKHNSSDIWCSNCDENFDEIPQKFLFCPNCGAKMRREGDRNETRESNRNIREWFMERIR